MDRTNAHQLTASTVAKDWSDVGMEDTHERQATKDALDCQLYNLDNGFVQKDEILEIY